MNKTRRKFIKVFSSAVVVGIISTFGNMLTHPKEGQAVDCSCYCDCYCNCHINCYSDRGRR
ncbi:MAG: hypothetical protein QXL14_01530 [Candidatus Aenigmatarchaeota archaeon]